MSEKSARYDAHSIRVLSDEEVTGRFAWVNASALAAKYGRNEDWISRGLAACEAAGVSPDYFVRRYLQKDKNVPLHDGVEAAFVAALDNAWMR